MTCIVGIAEDGKVYIGGDSLGSNGHNKKEFTRPKVFKNGDFILGYTSSYRMGQLLEASFEAPERLTSETDDFKYLINKVIPAIKSCFKTAGYEESKSGVEQGGIFLIGYKGCLYKIQADYSMLGSSEAATGSGQDFAIGSLHTSAEFEMTPKERITAAIEAASFNCATVGGPVNIVEQ